MKKPPVITIKEHEERTIVSSEMRANTETRTLEGYAAVFSQYSENMGGFFEIIEPGAFDDVLGEDVRCLLNHDPNIILGRTSAGTLSLSVDEKGLKFNCQLPDTNQANDLCESIARGDINQCSFKFQVKDVDWFDDDQRGWVRSITKFLHLYDVGPVTFPAYATTEATVRSLEEAKQQKAQPPVTNSHVLKNKMRSRSLQLQKHKKWDGGAVWIGGN